MGQVSFRSAFRAKSARIRIGETIAVGRILYAITFDRADHPPKLHRRGKYALIINPLIESYGFSKTLMDGGSSINILYVETLAG